MKSAVNILKKYWGFNSFRPAQEEIIKSVLSKKDTVALLPTGGGKSICFQVPALVNEGICIVISPLIALMKDQVNQLKKRGIKATLIKSGSSSDEIITLFDNLKFGNFKFLYISPERLQSKLIQQKITELNVNLVAIDEAHCISEWGHDFRPAYRHISVLKSIFTDVSFIALTASATDKVIQDIVVNLEFKSPVIFKNSFKRENLAYQIFKIEDKLTRLKQIFTKTKLPAIIYVNSRKKTEEISNFLNANSFKSHFFHSKLSADQKEKNFEDWMTEKVQIMVATNAFGMGIDKANVAVVIHLDIPNSIENYLQEAGRAGRNNKKAFANLLYHNDDVRIFKKRLVENHPSINDVKAVYLKLFQYFRIAKGELILEKFDFNLLAFCEHYQFKTNKTAKILQILINYGVLELQNNFNKKSIVLFKSSSKQLLNYANTNKKLSNFLKTFLRTYAGVFEQETQIDEFLLAKKSSLTSYQIIQFLEQLQKDEIVIYQKNNADASLSFLHPREDDFTINRISKQIKQYTHQQQKKGLQLLAFIENDTICRSIQLLDYFDEKKLEKCGICDFCLQNKKAKVLNYETHILTLLRSQKECTAQEIIISLGGNDKDILVALRALMGEEKISLNQQQKFTLL